MKTYSVFLLTATFLLSGCTSPTSDTLTVSSIKLKAGEKVFAEINDQDIAAYHLKGKLNKNYLLKGVEYLPNHKERTLFSMEIESKKYDSTLRVLQSSSAKYIHFGANLEGGSIRAHEALKQKPVAFSTTGPSSNFTLSNYDVLLLRHVSTSGKIETHSLEDIYGPEDIDVKKDEQIFALVLTASE
ncbi:hypothetical protein [Exiguobacterium sp. RIT594]|uniref:hypothetical protein n=1 Tax=Exiguobacterium sp. RIT594 TaxID=2282449 RepID=UPI000DF724F8|nr:hypothetical protein [Exiguobacterium sp. RIT594]RDB32420.1 hypothetical protein DVG79_13605 [Exiguobacterium sp. RIT594]